MALSGWREKLFFSVKLQSNGNGINVLPHLGLALGLATESAPI